MGKRKRIGIIFSYNEEWIGGTYYSINLINSFKFIKPDLQPYIIVFSNLSDFNVLKKNTDYPYLIYEYLNDVKFPIWKQFINKLFSRLFGIYIFNPFYNGYLDALFLLQNCNFLNSIPLNKRIYWIPDFQYKHLPELYTFEVQKHKDKKYSWIAENAHHLILSSNAVFKDWEKYFPNYNCKVNVINFAVTHPPYDHLSIHELKKQYNLPEIYFFSPNQFWVHKNHMVVIKAAQNLKKKGYPVFILFSGKENDIRNLDYTNSLKEYVSKNKLEDVVCFLGFLDRAVQLQIMKNARAIIQPSRFEGWSTVVEDAMAMNQTIIASDLEVNREQLGDKGWYFGVDSPDELANILFSMQLRKYKVEYDYLGKIEKFAKSIHEITDNIN